MCWYVLVAILAEALCLILHPAPQAFRRKESASLATEIRRERSTNQVAEAYGIVEIPVVWLVDRHGLLRDLEGREGQERKIAALLKLKER
jgi:hypothetical protein